VRRPAALATFGAGDDGRARQRLAELSEHYFRANLAGVLR